jgi:selenide,water dikinase
MARGAGCGCKLAPGLLAEALARMPGLPEDPDVLVGHAGFDDAAVYRLRDDLALVASVDFFTPMVDEPEVFGAIAATNALSDLYAMGATPLMALAVACFPRDADPAVLGAVMRAGAETAASHGCPVLGGHTVDDPEPKYGLAVLGTAHPDRLLTNGAGRPGDVLVLTKPLGVGIAIAAAAMGDASALPAAVESMLASNRAASEAALAHGVRCATDVTGFGLLGHLREMAAASGLEAVVDAGRAPALPGAHELAARGHAPGGAGRNRDFLTAWVDVDAVVPDPARALLVDPQTSGGLLLAVGPSQRDALLGALEAAGAGAYEVGILRDGPPGRIRVALGVPQPAG